MSESVNMSVSAINGKNEDRVVYVLFTDEEKSAELSLPGCKIISNKGFSEEELTQLKTYAENSEDYIFSLAKEINPMKAFMK